jgi:hypothetical protein
MTYRSRPAPSGNPAEITARGPQSRPRHDTAERSKRLLRGNHRALGLAEIMAGVVHDAVERGSGDEVVVAARRTWASVSTDPFPWVDPQLTEAVQKLTALTLDYLRDGEVEVSWPDALSGPVPHGSRVKSGRRGRC